MIDYGHGTVGYVLTLISIIHASFASIISLMVVAIIIYHHYNNRLKQEEKITLLLSANIYLIIFIEMAILISINIYTLLGDVYGINFDSSWCTFTRYFMIVMPWALFHSFVVQAFYRLCRIVYSNYRRLQLFWFYVIIIPIQVVVPSILLSPALITHDIIYIPKDYYCFISFRNIRGILWSSGISYGVPLICLLLMYIRITLFLRQQSTHLPMAIQRRHQRDLLVIQRIFINFGLLIVLGLPGMSVLFITIITGVEHPLSYRISWTGLEVSIAVLSIEMILMTPQLKHIVIKRWQQNRLMVIEGPLRMRPITTAQ